MRYLLDTDICIYLIKHHPPELCEKFKKHSPKDIAKNISRYEWERIE
jgi:tRNA(fMet)-specific endonuclease VapC